MPSPAWPISILAAYLLGAIPFGLIIARSRGVDIRSVGSGNIGATNVMRAVGKRAGALCFALDFLKGFGPVLGAGLVTGAIAADPLPQREAWLWLTVLAAAILGHIYPVWAGFKGGKGVATSFGAMLGVWPMLGAPALAAFALWLICQRLTRNVGLSSSIAAAFMPLAVISAQMLLRPDHRLTADAIPFILAATALGALVIWRHRTNLARTFGWAAKAP